MGELEKYGLLSLGSVAVLFLVLTFVHRDLESQELKRTPASGPEEPVVLLAAPPSAREEGRVEPPPVATPVVHRSVDAVAAAPGENAVNAAFGGDAPSERRTSAPAVPAPAADPGPAASRFDARVVRVGRGDTLYRIAERELGEARRWPEIVALNGHIDPRNLRVGDELILPREPPAPAVADPRDRPPRRPDKEIPTPSARTHRVVEGDTLSEIAHRYYGDARLWNRILQANRAQISDLRRLRLGTVLNLP